MLLHGPGSCHSWLSPAGRERRPRESTRLWGLHANRAICSGKMWRRCSNALQALRRFEAALDSYGQALKIKPDNAEAYNNRGTALKELKRFEEALAYTQMCERYFL